MDLPTPSPSDKSPEPPDLSMHTLHPDPSKSEGSDDPLLSPLFLFPGEDASTSSSSGSSSQHSGSPRNDWGLSGAMWTQCSDPKPQALDDLTSLGLNFSQGLSAAHWSSMDMDTDISAFLPDPPEHLSIDQNALHFDSAVYNGSHGIPTSGNCDSMFQFTLSQPSDTMPTSFPPFQLPTPKPGSTSSRSVSPATSGAEQSLNAGVNPCDLSLYTHIGQKARDASGVMLAVPVQHGSQAPVSPGSADPQDVPAKVPIPRLRQLGATASQKSQLNVNQTVHSMPPASQPASSPSSAFLKPSSAVVTIKSGRPKTSHTTIERRYRTNLNTRILALRRAVPALRILEKNNANQTQGKGLTGASAGKWDFDDVVNARGYVDGVKAAKKNSKGVVLGKAVEYIKSLKRRELRLKRESDGLRALISGLVGGSDLLCEWEREWRERFGGEEADEVDEDADENEGDDGEGDEGEDGYSDDEDGHAKKRTRVEKKEHKQPELAEKRKRGRPRKNPAPIPDAPRLVLQPPAVQDQRQPSKYLLAAFMFFSFFNLHAPTASAPGTGHEGMVLSYALPDASSVSTGWSVTQAIHVLVSVLLFVSLAGAFFPKRLTHFLSDTFLFASSASTSTRSSSSTQICQKVDEQPTLTTPIPSVQVSRGAAISDALTTGDEQALRDVLGADGGMLSVVKFAILAGLRALQIHRRTAINASTRQEDVELQGWRRLAQKEVVRGENSSLLARVQIYLSLSSRLLSSKVSPTDNMTLALLAYSFAASTAGELWETARRADTKTSAESLVLEMDVEDVVRIVALAPHDDTSSDDCDDESPVHRLAAYIVLLRAKALAAHNFVSFVLGTRPVDMNLDGESRGDLVPGHNADTKMVIAVGRELGGLPGALTSLLDKVERCPAAEVLVGLPPLDYEEDSNSSDSSSEGDAPRIDTQSDEIAKDVRVLLVATLLYRRIFPAEDVDAAGIHVPSPPPTPKSGALHLALRRALASAAFDANLETEDARDKVVDMLGETRRARWGAMS